ncbi:hypothetical protein JVU11DRAFT_12623 [Chiua virens]|nr:hypothetical protein JVU11DRAFT_12623 [Chiua virens]
MEGPTLQDLWVSRVTAINAFSALVLVVWDWLICLDEEITWIWPQPLSTIHKWIYLFCRYAPFGCHTINILFVRRMEQHGKFSISTCRMWLAYQGVVVEIFLAVVEGLLMIRVYALWGRSRRIFTFLALSLAIEISCFAISLSIIVGNAYFNELCIFNKPPLLYVLFSVAALAMQLSIIILTLSKSPLRRTQQPALVTFVTREGSVVSFTVCALLIASFVYLLLDTKYGDIIFYWVLSILSVCGCRLVLAVHRFSSSANLGESWIEEVCFTSVCIIEPEPEPEPDASP